MFHRRRRLARGADRYAPACVLSADRFHLAARMSAAGAGSVVLSDVGSGLEATFVPSAGMLCASLRQGGQELLAQNAGVAAYAERGKTMGIPLLYPWANRLAGFSYAAAGKTVELPREGGMLALDGRGLPIHGVVPGRMRWEVASAGASALSARLRWSEEDVERFAVFPFRHDLQYRASLSDGRLSVEVTAHAAGEDVVPVSFGLHPYLTLPGSPRESWLVELPAMRRLQLDSQQIPAGPGAAAPAECFELGERELDDGFEDVEETARFALSRAHRSVELEFLRGYRFAQVYAPRSGQFICFEPMTAPANALRSGVGLTLLAPGESRTAAVAVTVRGLP
jgi:galactose mutarotase-like enzyme